MVLTLQVQLSRCSSWPRVAVPALWPRRSASSHEWEYFECKQESANNQNKIWILVSHDMKGLPSRLRLSQPVVVQYLVPSVLFLSVSFLSRVSLASGMAMPRVAAATIMLLTLNGLRAQVQEQMPVGGEFRGWSHAVANTL